MAVDPDVPGAVYVGTDMGVFFTSKYTDPNVPVKWSNLGSPLKTACYASGMRAYKFLNAKFGLDGLRKKRLRQSRLHELNDPFELTPYDLTNPSVRQTFLQTRQEVGEGRAVVCFSSDWCDPVIWAHYSDKHRGLCLGFEIPEIKGDAENDESAYVSYIEKPLCFPAKFLELEDQKRFEVVRTILFTKFKHWEYEHEIR